MTVNTHNKLVSFIWSIADDCLRDVYVRGKYRDVILPMVVLRRIDALLEEKKQEVLEEVNRQVVEEGAIEYSSKRICYVSGYPFYNTSKWTLQMLFSTVSNSKQQLIANFEEYLDGFDVNIKEVISKFDLRRQIRHMADKDVLLDVIEKFTSPYINLTPEDKLDPEGNVMGGLSNLGMGYVFEELIRRFNEENNEEAGEHFTPREVIQLMTHLVFEPIKEQLPNIITIYDPACGSGGMLTESENLLVDENEGFGLKKDIYLYGKEINDETYAICKSDMLIKGKNPEHIKVGSTLSTNEFSSLKFDFMLSNPPYGKSWASEQKYIKDGKDVIDSRFIVKLKDYWGKEEEVDATPRSSDGQLLFLMEMVDKMKDVSNTGVGSRIASVHNGSSLFTGDAGGGESNIRRYIIENDLLDAIVQLPNNMFYNTGITTYIWLLTNNKPANRKGKVQLIDANKLFQKMRKNLGSKNSEFSQEHIQAILDAYLNFSEGELSNGMLNVKLFDNADFGYYKVNIERPKRLKTQFTEAKIESLRYDKAFYNQMESLYAHFGEEVYAKGLEHRQAEVSKYADSQDWGLNKKQLVKLCERDTWTKSKELFEQAITICEAFGQEVYMDFNQVQKRFDAICKDINVKLSATDKKAILSAVSEYDATAERVIKKVEKLNADKLAQLVARLGCTEAQLADYGYYATAKKGEYITYETESDLRDSEQIPLSEAIYNYFIREVKLHVEEAWINLDSVKIGYEISFNKYFYKHIPLRSIEEVKAELLALEEQADGILNDILNF